MRNSKKVLKFLILLTIFWIFANALSVYISYDITMFKIESVTHGVPTWAMIIYFAPFILMIIWLCVVAWYFHLKREEVREKKRKEDERIKYEALMNAEAYRKTRRY